MPASGTDSGSSVTWLCVCVCYVCVCVCVCVLCVVFCGLLFCVVCVCVCGITFATETAGVMSPSSSDEDSRVIGFCAVPNSDCSADSKVITGAATNSIIFSLRRF